MSYLGIDYGLGRTNIDNSNGICYGVISISSLYNEIYNDLESHYMLFCPMCECELSDDMHDGDMCPYCNKEIDEIAYADEPYSHTLNDPAYLAESCFDHTELFVIKSLYYTHAQYCSPCAPGACNLNSSVDSREGPKCYCMGHDYFESGKAPYRVFRVSDGSEVLPIQE